MLLHGFPDNHHLYDRLVRMTERHVVVFDFLGWAESDKPTDTTTPSPTRSVISTRS